MRELKFRAYDKVKKEWLWPYPEGFNIIGEVTIFDIIRQYSIGQFNDIEILQYTGLKDSKDTKIYEGEIVAVIHNKNLSIQEKQIKIDKAGNDIIVPVMVGEKHIEGRSLYLIEYDLWGCKFYGKFIRHEPESLGQDLGFGDLFLHPDSENCKFECVVIGNSYENSELLEAL